MPNRIIREGWVESLAIDQLDANAERFFLRLCLRADDFGRYHAHPQLLKSNLFPLRENVRSTDMSRDLAACEKAGLVRCYEVSGVRYLMIEKFGQRTRAKHSKFPPPPDTCPTHVGHMSDMRPTDDGHMRTETETETETETIFGDGDERGADARPPLVVPLLLNVPEFLGPWAHWQAIRRKGKKPKSSWDVYFAKQLEWLATYGLQTAIEIVATSARNEWQGLFEPKGGGRREPVIVDTEGSVRSRKF